MNESKAFNTAISISIILSFSCMLVPTFFAAQALILRADTGIESQSSWFLAGLFTMIAGSLLGICTLPLVLRSKSFRPLHLIPTILMPFLVLAVILAKGFVLESRSLTPKEVSAFNTGTENRCEKLAALARIALHANKEQADILMRWEADGSNLEENVLNKLLLDLIITHREQPMSPP